MKEYKSPFYPHIKNASILKDHVCANCEWPIVFVLSNDGFTEFKPGLEDSDYYVYCSNKNCCNHEGSDYGQQHPPWVKTICVDTEIDPFFA
jgi:hypothetical protein